MTYREAFEAFTTNWIEDDCPSIKADLLERKGDTYAHAMQRVQWKTWQAALATAPQWHDAPTVPGLWIAANGSSYMVTPEMIGQTAPARRWYGPIPQENK